MKIRIYDYIVGVDVGKMSDYTAISVIEQEIDSGKHILRGLTRFRHVSYTEVVNRVAEIIGKLQGRICLVVDSTGVGQPVCDMLAEQGFAVHRLTITGGHNVKKEGYSLSVPKERLVFNAQIIIQNQNIVVPATLGKIWTEARNEFENFAMKPTASGESLTYEALRSSQKDDLVLSILLALWLSGKEYPVHEIIDNSDLEISFGESSGEYVPPFKEVWAVDSHGNRFKKTVINPDYISEMQMVYNPGYEAALQT